MKGVFSLFFSRYKMSLVKSLKKKEKERERDAEFWLMYEVVNH